MTETHENTTLFPGPFDKNYSQYIVLDTNKDLSLILTEPKSSIKIWTKFLDMVTKQQNRKDHSVSTIFFIYSIFSNRNQISLFSHKAYDKFIIMTEKKWGAHACWWVIAIFQLTELNIKVNPPCFYVRAYEGALNDDINYAQKGCAMQMWGISLIIVGSLAVGAFDLVNWLLLDSSLSFTNNSSFQN